MYYKKVGKKDAPTMSASFMFPKDSTYRSTITFKEPPVIDAHKQSSVKTM